MYLSIVDKQTNNLIRNQIEYWYQDNAENEKRMISQWVHNQKRCDAQLLYRKDNGLFYIQSKDPLNEHAIQDSGYQLKGVRCIDGLYDKFQVGDNFKIIVRCSPHKQSNGKVIWLQSPDDRIEWIQRKMQQIGMQVVNDNESGNPLIIETCKQTRHVKHNKNQINQGDFKFPSWDYTIIVSLSNKQLFLEKYTNGIGRNKSYGCGLMVIGVA